MGENPPKMEYGRLPSYYLLCLRTWRGARVTELMPAKCNQRALKGRDPCKDHTKQAQLASYLGLVRL